MEPLEIILNHFEVRNFLKNKGLIRSLFQNVDLYILPLLEGNGMKIYIDERDGMKIYGAYGTDLLMYGAVFQGNTKVWETTKDGQFIEAIRQFRI